MPFTEPQPGRARAIIDTMRGQLAELEVLAAGDALIVIELEALREALARIESHLPSAPAPAPRT